MYKTDTETLEIENRFLYRRLNDFLVAHLLRFGVCILRVSHTLRSSLNG